MEAFKPVPSKMVTKLKREVQVSTNVRYEVAFFIRQAPDDLLTAFPVRCFCKVNVITRRKHHLFDEFVLPSCKFSRLGLPPG